MKITKGTWIFIIILILLMFYSKFTRIKSKSDMMYRYNEYYMAETLAIGKKYRNDTLKLNQKSVYNELVKIGIKFPEIVLRQSILETGHYKSNVCLQYKNLFGFYNGKRYLRFNTYKDCIKFCKKWQDKKYKSGDYYKFLKELPYAQDTTYVNQLKKIKINV